MMTEQHLSNIAKLIDDFSKKTKDSPTHILVTEEQWKEMNCPETYEHSVSCCLDFLVVHPMGNYNHPSFPMIAQLPQYFHEPDKPKMIIFKLGRWSVCED